MSETFSCWPTLSEAEKRLCLEAKPGPRRELQYQTQKLYAWRVAGKLLEEWNRIAPEIKSRTAKADFRSRIAPGKPEKAVIRWALYLVGKLPETSKLKPTIVAECADIDVAKRACKALQEMKEHSLEPLLGTYDLHYALAQVRLRAEQNGLVPPEPSDRDGHDSLCGQQVIISSHLGEQKPIFTTSTVGGAVLVGGTYYALTAAHAFPVLTTDHPASNKEAQGGIHSHDQSDHESKNNAAVSDHAPASRDVIRLTSSVYVQKCDRNTIDPEDLSVSVQPSTRVDALINNASQHVMLNRSQDWALVPIENHRFEHENSFTSPDGRSVRVTGITADIPCGPVVVATGVSQAAVSAISKATSLLLLPGCEQLQVVWSVEKPSAPGDCGSWVIDENGKACAMVVAASEDDDEIYCLPLAPIFHDIQWQMGSDRRPQMPLDGELPATPGRTPPIHGFHDGQPLTVNGKSQDTLKANRPMRQDTSTNENSLISAESSDSRACPNRAESGHLHNPPTLQTQQEAVTSKEGVSAKTTAADKETGTLVEPADLSSGHNPQVDKPKMDSDSNEHSAFASHPALGINQKVQGKRANTSTVSFQSSVLDSRNLRLNELERQTKVREEIRERRKSPPPLSQGERHDRLPLVKASILQRERENFGDPRSRPRSRSPEPERITIEKVAPPTGDREGIIMHRDNDALEKIEDYKRKLKARLLERAFSQEEIEALLQVDDDGTKSTTDRSETTRHKGMLSSNRQAPRPAAREPLRYQLADRPFHDSDHIDISKITDWSSGRYAYRHKFGSHDRFVRISGREISPFSLETLGIQWDWDPHDDYYLWMAPVTDHEMQTLQNITQRKLNGYSTSETKPRRPLSGPADTRTPEGRTKYIDEHKIVRYEDNWPYESEETGYSGRRRSRSRTRASSLEKHRSRYYDELGPVSESKGTGADRGLSKHTVAEDSMTKLQKPEAKKAIQDVEKKYRAQLEKQKSVDSECRLLDLEFEATVQDLFWDAGLAPEICDTVIKMHQDKEARMRAHNHDEGHHSHDADHCSTCNGLPKATSEQREEGDDEKRKKLACSMKAEIDGVIIPCDERFETDDALMKHEESHLPLAPYHVEYSNDNQPPLQRRDSLEGGYTTIKRYVVREREPDIPPIRERGRSSSRQRVRDHEYVGDPSLYDTSRATDTRTVYTIND